jgi:D-3-phosphoglycerate dehydrogenase / 2-oxoglutarate reductase
MKILANDGISPEAIQLLERAGMTVLTEKIPQENLAKFIQENTISVLLVRSATKARKDLIDACPSLLLIGRGGVGMDNIDVDYAREQGKVVINTPAASSQSVAELVLGHFLSGARYLNQSFSELNNENFNSLKKDFGQGIELRGKTLLIIGFGRIGQSLASYAIGIGMKVRAVGKIEEIVTISLNHNHGIDPISVKINVSTNLETELKSADFISLHVPKQENGQAIIGKKELTLLKENVLIVNASRGGVIDENELLLALENGKIRYVGLDVFENEPNPNNALLKHPKIGATPHIGAATIEAQDRIGTELAELIIEFSKKG